MYIYLYNNDMCSSCFCRQFYTKNLHLSEMLIVSLIAELATFSDFIFIPMNHKNLVTLLTSLYKWRKENAFLKVSHNVDSVSISIFTKNNWFFYSSFKFNWVIFFLQVFKHLPRFVANITFFSDHRSF